MSLFSFFYDLEIFESDASVDFCHFTNYIEFVTLTC